jgi:hypothetical protein
MGQLLPRFEGEIEIPSLPPDFPSRMERRVELGLFVKGSRSRANYRVVARDENGVEFQAADVSTAINLGLNDVVLRRSAPGRIAYRVTYRTWTGYVVAIGATVGIVLALGYFLIPVMRQAIGSRPGAPAFFWTALAFWGLLWPWILTGLHKRFAARALERILRDEFPG